MRKIIIFRACIMLMLFVTCVTSIVNAASIGEKRQSIRDMANETLDRLYNVNPGARNAIENSAGYAVFSNHGIKLLVLGSGHGKGIAVNNNSSREVFMKKAEIGIGLGLGIKDYSEIFVFETEKAFARFVDQGWSFGGQATLAATDGVNGGAFQGAVSIWPGAWLYQLTDKGLALEITGQGTRYYKDNDLNSRSH
ncbi:YSC84-related protein [Sporomusa malonica]|uniref:Lipid-binding SYLF domain-containing protein n=1 Tax=Sporomusa malonica TaxID=112901 RepID=A0A1W2ETQ8_9FIRM|nr:YSC84-related protein [Sporomusa malonica]SMD12606.1 Lipid-binding SYLF domain-containing protein [Sporomusa malonica]